jgi:hypothetical protein
MRGITTVLWLCGYHHSPMTTWVSLLSYYHAVDSFPFLVSFKYYEETVQTGSVEISITGLTFSYVSAYAWPRFQSGDVIFFVCLLDSPLSNDYVDITALPWLLGYQHYPMITWVLLLSYDYVDITTLLWLLGYSYAWPRFQSGDVIFFVCLLDCDDRLLLS